MEIRPQPQDDPNHQRGEIRRQAKSGIGNCGSDFEGTIYSFEGWPPGTDAMVPELPGEKRQAWAVYFGLPRNSDWGVIYRAAGQG